MEALTSALLYLDGVTVSFDGFKALNNLSFTIEPGEMRAIIGPNGAGKTTMMDVVTGKTRPDTRRCRVRRRRTISPGSTRPRSPSSASAANSRSRRCSTVTPCSTISNWRSKPTAARAPRCGGARRRERAQPHRRNSGTIRLTAVRDRLAGSLSHGQKQWLEIGMLLAQDPKLLLVDEPVAGMTDAETAADRGAAQGDQPRAHRRRGRARHDFRARPRRQGHLLHEGSVLAEGTIDQVSQNERVVEVYLGR